MNYNRVSALLLSFVAAVCFLFLPNEAKAQSPSSNEPAGRGTATFYGTNPFGLPGARGEMIDTADRTATTYQVNAFADTAASPISGNTSRFGLIGLLGITGFIGLLGRSRLS